MVLGRPGLHAYQRNDRSGSCHSFRLDGKHSAYRRSSDHEPHRLRRWRALHQLARAPVAQSAPPANDYLQAPYAPDTTDLIKRTIGLPGDTVDLRDGTVYINGQEFNEPYTIGPTEPAPPGSAPRGYANIKFPYHVPDNCYFAMGDNRTNSYDMRVWGCVPRNDIIGTPVMIYMSLDVPSDAWQPGQIRERFFTYARAILHPGVVRWRRLFQTF